MVSLDGNFSQKLNRPPSLPPPSLVPTSSIAQPRRPPDPLLHVVLLSAVPEGSISVGSLSGIVAHTVEIE